MKANNIVVYTLTALAISFIYSSCKKSSSDCGSIVADAISPFAILQVRNNQNKDLLDPTTTGHYDTAYIKRLNPWLVITRPGTLPVMLGFNYLNAEQNVLTLNASDLDTIHVKTETVAEKCYTYTKITEFKYNNTILKADSAQSNLFVIHK